LVLPRVTDEARVASGHGVGARADPRQAAVPPAPCPAPMALATLTDLRIYELTNAPNSSIRQFVTS